MTTTSERPAPPVETPADGRSAWQVVRPLLVRLHFYAGVLVAPFLLVAAATGLLFALAPQLDRWTYGELRVAQVGDQRRPVDEQVAAARAAHPEGGIAAVVVAEDPELTTRVILDVEGLAPERQRTVFVDPYTAEVRGALTTWFDSTPLTTWLDLLHRDLHLGATGSLYSELAASWLWVIALGGLALWLGRRRSRRRLRRTLLPDLSTRGTRRTMGWHGATGGWLVLGLLVLSATGLTWSEHAGARFTDLRAAISAQAPVLDTSLGSTVDGGSGHAGHQAGAAGSGAGTTGWDRAVQAGTGAGLSGPLRITPGADGGAWSVAETDVVWPVRQDQVAVHPGTGAVTATLAWADSPTVAKLSTLGINAHMGVLFGLPNQLLLAALAFGLLCMIVWGYRMWWQRRPTTRPLGRPPAPGGWRRVPLAVLVPAIVLVAAVGWALPVLGVSLLAFLAVDLARATVVRARR